MSFFGWGPNSIESTTIGLQTTLSTSSLLAEVDLNGTNVLCPAGGRTYGVTWIVGTGNTGATFLLDHANSTTVTTGGIRNQTLAPVTSNASAQYFTKHAAVAGDRFRVRLMSSVVAACAKIIVEPLV